MKLTNFTYNSWDWHLENLELDTVNLIVGKNAVGKSKAIAALNEVILLLLQKLANNPFNVNCKLTFTEKEEKIEYEFNVSDKIIKEEYLTVDGKELLNRQETQANLHNEDINPPENKLVLHVRRDIKQYPYIEKIMQWAENSHGVLFNELDYSGDSSVYSYLMVQAESLYNMTSALTTSSLKKVIKAVKGMGYPIKNIRIQDPAKLKAVEFLEEGVDHYLWYFDLSKGMYRTIYLLIFVEYLATLKTPKMLVIDDLCEGLDYDRATKLGKFLFDFCLKKDIQLVASSNDSFLMDVVDIQYWNVLQRNGEVVTAINKHNNPQLFENFSYTGLSNFDFFSSDYIARHNGKQKNE